MFWEAAERPPPTSSCTLQLWRGPNGFISIPCQHIKILIIAFGWCLVPNQRTNWQYASPDVFHNLFLNSNETVFLLIGAKPSWNGGNGFIFIPHKTPLWPVRSEPPWGACNWSPLSGVDQRWDTRIGTLPSCNHNKTHSKTDTQTKNEIAAIKERQTRMLAASN